MTAITRVLVPTDFSPTADAALTYAKGLAGQLQASLHLVHAFEDPFTTAGFASEGYATLPPALRDQILGEAAARLDERLTAAERLRFKASTAVVLGTPTSTIVECAGTLGADLIVMGTHGRGGMAHVLLGSVAERVVRAAPCPVLTLRERPTGDVRHVLVPTDFSTTADAALEHAFSLAACVGADVHLVHVLDDPFVAAGMAPETYIAAAPALRTEMLRDAQASLTQRSLPPTPEVAVHTDVLFGHPAKTIAEYAAMRRIDLIVMGTHGRTGVAHLVLGSVAERLVRTAPCPVFTVRQTPTAKAYAELTYDIDHLPA